MILLLITQYVCDEAYTGRPLEVTTIGFVGGVPALPTTSTKQPKIVYNIGDVVVKGDIAVFTVKRSGTDIASSLKFKTLNKLGTATPGVVKNRMVS